MEDVFVDTQLLKRVEVKRQEWKAETPDQLTEAKPWKNKALQELEEALPPMRAEDFEKWSKSVTWASTGVGSDGFHPEVALELSTEIVWGNRGFVDKNGSNVAIGQFKSARSSLLFRRMSQ